MAFLSLSLGFLGLAFDCPTLILIGDRDKRVRNLKETYIIHLVKEQTLEGFEQGTWE